MKWKCTYSPEEKEEAASDLEVLRQRHPGAKVRKSAAQAPKLCVYLTTKNPGKPCSTEEKA